MRIKVKSAQSPEAWYADKIGEEFETYGDAFEYGEKGNIVYFIKDVPGYWFVRVDDAEILCK